MPRGNPSPKLAITVDPEVHRKILAAAAGDGVSVSAWMTRAAREPLQRRAGLAAVAAWEKRARIGVQGDPLKDVTVLEDVTFVMKGGTVYKRRAVSR